MLAAQITRFGGPEVLEIVDVPQPVAGPGEVVVRVEAASVNGHDTIVRSGGLKLVSGRRFPIGVGLDFVGVVASTGQAVDQFEIGDRVWGMVHPRKKHRTGSAAQFVVVTQDRIGLAPTGVSAVEAASLVVAGTTALIALRDVLQVRAGSRLLVRGASGGVGSAAVQLADAMGVHVTTLAGGRHADELRSLGAEEVLDRADVDPSAIGPFDAVLDLVGSELGRYRRTLDKQGRMVLVAISGPALRSVAVSLVHGARRIRTFSANPNTEVLDALAAAVVVGSIRPVIASVRPLQAVAEAQEAFEHTSALGKHVLSVAADISKPVGTS